MCQIERGPCSGGVFLGSVGEIRASIRSKYAQVAVSAKGKFQYPTGREGVVALRYDERGKA